MSRTSSRTGSRGSTRCTDLNQYVYQGVYPNGNAAVLDLLGKGQIWVAPVWSDQSLTALKTGQLPASNIKLTQISNPSFTGGAAYLGVPKTAKHKADVYKFVNYVLSPAAQTADHQRHVRLPGDPTSSDAEGDQEEVRGRLRELAPADVRDRRGRATSRRSGSRRCRSRLAPSCAGGRSVSGAQGLLMVLPPVAVVAVFIGFPVVAAIAYTLGRAGGPNSSSRSLAQRQFIVHHGVTLDAYRDILGNTTIHRDLWATIWVTIVVTLVVVVDQLGDRALPPALRTPASRGSCRRSRSCRSSSRS